MIRRPGWGGNRRWRLATILLALVLVSTACSGGAVTDTPDDPFPVVANADLAVGPQRVLIGLVTVDARSFSSPDLPVQVSFYPPGSDQPTEPIPATFLWTVPDIRGLYVVEFEFDQPGIWEVALETAEGFTSVPSPFSVAETSLAPSVGDPAPPSKTTTSDDAQLGDISTDPQPDPRFYQQSLDEAFSSGRPTVVVFATPAFCQTATCGPMLNVVKAVAAEYPGINFVHVEIYENLDAESFEDLQVAPAVDEWRLPSEPWVYVVDGSGIVVARYEGTIGTSEIRTALEELR